MRIVNNVTTTMSDEQMEYIKVVDLQLYNFVVELLLIELILPKNTFLLLKFQI